MSDTTHQSDETAIENDETATLCQVIRREIVHLRWRVLLLAMILPLGSYAAYDQPGAIGMGRTDSIEAKFQADAGKPFTTEMNLALYSICSWPNTVLSFAAGIIIDGFVGLRRGLLMFVALVLCGQVIFHIGVLTTHFPVMMVGRFIFGLGGESLGVAQSAYIARWFRGASGMALAFGITVSIALLGSSMNFFVAPRIATASGVEQAVLFETCLCVVSLVSCIALVFLDIYGVKHGIVPPENCAAAAKVDDDDGDDKQEQLLAENSINNNSDDGKTQSVETGRCTCCGFDPASLKKLGIRFWLLCAICVTLYCSCFPFVGVAKNFFEVKYSLSQDDAATLVSIYQFVCAGISPVVGAFIDKTGRFCQWMILSSVMFTLVHLIFWLAPHPNPAGMMVVMGFAYSFIASSLWPSVPFLVESELTATAYGAMTSLQNIGLSVYPLIVGALSNDVELPFREPACKNFTDSNFNKSTLVSYAPGALVGCVNNTDAPLPPLSDFNHIEIFLMCTAAVSAVFGVWLFVLDRRGGDDALLSCAPERRPTTSKPKETAGAAAADDLQLN